ncbi:MAG: hypothetical protein H0X37_25765 [Herpetosiphonaceae bacterium]|nr:hypothetical protein [Herpetosiphonaceae bacterium]
MIASSRATVTSLEELNDHLADVPDSGWFEQEFLPQLRRIIREEVQRAIHPMQIATYSASDSQGINVDTAMMPVPDEPPHQ